MKDPGLRKIKFTFLLPTTRASSASCTALIGVSSSVCGAPVPVVPEPPGSLYQIT
jgi:hypothetical protein